MKKLVFTFSLLCFFLGLKSQDINFYAQLSQSQVNVGERFTLSFELENGDGKITPPPLTEFEIVYGPSTSQSYSFVNGVSSKKISIKYVLVAREEGEFKIAPATTEHKDQQYQTETLSLKVLKGQNKASAQNNKTNKVKTNSTGNIILEVSSNKRSAYVNEPITLTYTLYSRYNNIQLGDINLPSPDGFWVEDIPIDNPSWEPNLVNIGNYRYRQVVLAKRVVYPQKPGSLTTGQSEITCYVNRSFFDPGQKFEIESNQLSIKAKDLPQPKPSNFSGLVGDLKLSAELSQDSCSVDDAVIYTLKVSGTGNLRLLAAPQLQFPSDFEVYEPKTKNNLKVNINGIYGSKSFEWTLIPRYPGQYEIPSFSLPYLTPNKRYKSASSPKTTLNVVGGDQSYLSGGNAGGNSASRVRSLTEDIRFIYTGKPRHGESTMLSEKSPLIWILRLFLLIAFAVAYYLIGKNEKLKQNERHFKASKAAKKALKKLQELEKDKALKAADVYNVLVAFICERLQLDLALFKRQNLAEHLNQARIESSDMQALSEFLEKCEMAGYAIGQESPLELAHQARLWVKKLNRL